MGIKVSDQIKQEEADALRRLFDEANVQNFAAFARRYEIPGGKSIISQHLNKVRPISLECAVAYAIAFCKPLELLSRRLADLIARLPATSSAQALQAQEGPPAAYLQPRAPQATRPLENELIQVAAKLSDRGMHLLIDYAEQLAERHPRPRANHAA